MLPKDIGDMTLEKELLGVGMAEVHKKDNGKHENETKDIN